MANKAGTTVKASAISQDEDNTYFTIPASGFYDTSSKIYTENSNLGKEIVLSVVVKKVNVGGNATLSQVDIYKDGEVIFTLSTAASGPATNSSNSGELRL